MQIRQATETDIPGIIDVLKASLGESSSKKTEEVWRYKHIDNPFGESLVLIAEESGIIIGVRAFMRWQWKRGERDYSAFRAVDTATHPKHQGKGIFRKLTLKAIELAKVNGDHFIFNTPNSQSLPGYLKMGWRNVDKINVRVQPGNPLNWFGNKIFRSDIIDMSNEEASLLKLVFDYNRFKAEKNILFTLKSPQYLKWRYENNPLQKYEVRIDNEFYLAGYIKKHKFIRELRISEHIYTSDLGLHKMNSAINDLSKKLGPHIITSNFNNSPIGYYGNFGPVLTLRDVSLNPKIKEELLQLKNWSYTIGDLELF